MTSVHGVDRLRGNLPGRDLARGLRERRSAVRGIRASPRGRSLGAVLRALHARRADRLLGRKGERAARTANFRDRTRSAATTPTPTRQASARNPTSRPAPPRPPPAARRASAGAPRPRGRGRRWSRTGRRTERRRRLGADLGPGRAFALIWVGFLAYLGAARPAPRLGRRPGLGGDRGAGRRSSR